MTRSLAVGLLVLTAALAVAARREWTVGRDAIAASDAASARGAWGEAIAAARSAALARLPLSPWPALGLGRLDALARSAAARGDRDSALLAYGAMRAAAAATEVPPGSAWLAAAVLATAAGFWRLTRRARRWNARSPGG